jgi:hypothetical protein
MSHTIFEIEEILEHVIKMTSLGSEPDRRTLFAAARVNSQWSTIALNYLWADLKLQNLLSFLGYQNRKYVRHGCLRILRTPILTVNIAEVQQLRGNLEPTVAGASPKI